MKNLHYIVTDCLNSLESCTNRLKEVQIKLDKSTKKREKYVLNTQLISLQRKIQDLMKTLFSLVTLPIVYVKYRNNDLGHEGYEYFPGFTIKQARSTFNLLCKINKVSLTILKINYLSKYQYEREVY